MFATPMSVVPIYKPFLEDKMKLKITKHARKQFLIDKNIKSITVLGIKILNWCNSCKQNTMHRQLMQVESIHTKTVVKQSGNIEFKARVFYDIVPNQALKNITSYFSKASKEESCNVV